MRVLLYNWGFTKNDIIETFEKMGISYDLFGYSFADKNHDDFFEYRFLKCFSKNTYDIVFSVNYYPLIAKCCYEKGIKYVSWCYDNPLNVISIEDTLGLPTNYVFFFDRIQAQKYADMGFDNIYHVPLAVNADRLSKIVLSKEDHQKYGTDVSFVGRLYGSDFDGVRSLLSDYQRGFVDSVIKAQGSLYGCYLLDTVVTDGFVDDINRNITVNHPELNVTVSKEALVYAMAAQITREERLLILALIKNHCRTKLYSREWDNILAGIEYSGTCKYLNEMPRVFMASKINLNISLKMIQSGIPLRCLDIMGAGGFLLSNYQHELCEWFEPGKDFAMYESPEDALEKVIYYISHDVERNKIAKSGFEKVSRDFSFEKQISNILETAGVM